MADKTKIEWADATLNAINGCSLASPGCTNCYAMRLAGTRMQHHPTRAGLARTVNGKPVWTGEVRLHEPALLQALRWKSPRRIFWNAHGDTFHEAVPDEWIDKLFAVCALTPQHTHMILTKRSERMRKYLSRHRWHKWAAIGRALDAKRWRNLPPIMGGDCTPVPNVWLGVSVEDQARADERIPDLLATPAAVRFISAEPLLGPVDLCRAYATKDEHGTYLHDGPILGLDWVIAGGESGPGSRPMHPDWARSLRDQCLAAGVAFHFKQWGEWHPADADDHPADCTADNITAFRADQITRYSHWDAAYWSGRPGEQGMCRVGKKAAGRQLDGREWNELPR